MRQFIDIVNPLVEAKRISEWECWENPSGRSLNVLLELHGDLRGIGQTTKSGKHYVFVWPAGLLVHHMMRARMGIDEDEAFSIYVAPTSAEYEDRVDDEDRGDWVHYNKATAKIGNAAIYVEEDAKQTCWEKSCVCPYDEVDFI